MACITPRSTRLKTLRLCRRLSKLQATRSMFAFMARTARLVLTQRHRGRAVQIFVFGTGAPFARQRVRQSAGTRRQARVYDLQRLLSEFRNHERNYDGRDPSRPGAIARAGESAPTTREVACKRDGSIRRTYAVPTSGEVAGRFESGIRSQIRWLPGAGNQEGGPREADGSEQGSLVLSLNSSAVLMTM